MIIFVSAKWKEKLDCNILIQSVVFDKTIFNYQINIYYTKSHPGFGKYPYLCIVFKKDCFS